MTPISLTKRQGLCVRIYALFVMINTLYIECGHSAAIHASDGLYYYPVPRIVNGARAHHGGERGHPYLATLQRMNEKDGGSRCHYQHICGAVILDSQTVITAAHCFEKDAAQTCCRDNPEKCYRIVAGKHNMSNDVPEKEQILPIRTDSIKIHEGYQYPPYLDNDIALIHLDQELKFDLFVQPIALVDMSKTFGNTATIVGYGTNNSVPTEAKVQIYAEDRCSIWGNNFNSDLMLCAGSEISDINGKTSDACGGDSGGPLIVTDRDNPFRKYLLGLISGGFEDCGNSDYPGIYTKIAAYLDWIKDEQRISVGKKPHHNPKSILFKHLHPYYNRHLHNLNSNNI